MNVVGSGVYSVVAAVDPLTLIVVGGVIVVMGVLTLRPVRRIAVNTKSITVEVNASEPLVALLAYKPWFSFSFNMMPGTITLFTGSSVFTVNPKTFTTTQAQPDAVAMVTGVATGTGTVTVNGSSAEGAHKTVTVNVTVV